MALNSSGPISLGGAITGQSINLENGNSATAQVSLNDTAVRNLAGVPSGAISMPTNFWGKSNAFTFIRTIFSSVQNYNLLTEMQTAGYVNGSAFVVEITINPGVYLWSNSITTAGFDTGAITGTGTINIINNGYIMGKGGNGFITGPNTPQTDGGPAMNLQKAVVITNNSYIAGGGGASQFAGGAGGGNGGTDTSTLSPISGGAVGQQGNPGTNTGSGLAVFSASASGGRILPGTGGTGGTGGGGGAYYQLGTPGGAGAGGYIVCKQVGWCGTPGINPRVSNYADGGGGGWGAAGGSSEFFVQCAPTTMQGGNGGSAGNVGSNGNLPSVSGSITPGKAGGKAINLNANSVTWVATGTIYGAVS